MEPLDITYGVSRYANISGVTCYMNSILAILQQTPIFIDYILSGDFKEKLLKKNDISQLKSCILFQFHNIMTISNTHDNLIISPSTFRETLSTKNEMWGRQQQQDSQEFLTFLLNSIEEEICEEVIFIPGNINNNNYNNNQLSISDDLIKLQANSMWQKFIKKEFSIIKNLFCGMNHVTITCNICNNQVHNFDMFQILQLSICSNKLYDCLDKFITKETLDTDNMYNCEFCGRKNKASKNTKIWKAPPILVIQLKRFESYRGKITDLVDYPLELDLSKYTNGINKYKLFAINNHISNHTRSGHYTSIVKNRLDNTWYEFDDSNVLQKVEETDLVNKNAYMLFYYKINSN
jgi:ubiquitin carboxyl-terminal hydrolase 8